MLDPQTAYSKNKVEFENELALLYRQLGFEVETTPKTGDKGIDLVLNLNGETTIVQCKRHKQPVGPAIARELYGALMASNADKAILACTGGFTKGVYEFSGDKPIQLISTQEILRLVERVSADDVSKRDDDEYELEYEEEDDDEESLWQASY